MSRLPESEPGKPMMGAEHSIDLEPVLRTCACGIIVMGGRRHCDEHLAMLNRRAPEGAMPHRRDPDEGRSAAYVAALLLVLLSSLWWRASQSEPTGSIPRGFVLEAR